MSDKQLLGVLLLILAAFLSILHSRKILLETGKVIVSPDYPGAGLMQFTVAVIVLLISLSVLPKKSGPILAVLILVGGLSVNQSLVDSGTLTGPSLLDVIAGK